MKLKFTLFVAILALIALPVMAQDATPEPTPLDSGSYPLNTITVTGIGSAKGNPDIAIIELGVQQNAETASDAFAAVNSTIREVVAALTELGIAAEDINTSYLNLYPNQQYGPEGNPSGISSYTASNTIRVTVRDISNVEQVIDTAIAAGATMLNSLTFDVDDRTDLETEARADAINDARARAEQYASLIGAQLGDVVIVSETSFSGGIPFAAYDAAQGRGGGGAFVQPGQTEVQIQVQVTYRISC